MTYEERLQNVTVLGAAGKMGSGILLLTALEMADLMLKPGNKDKTYVLNAMDLSDEGLSGLVKYLRAQILKIAEKKTVMLRKIYQDRNDLIENSDIINQYIIDVTSIVRPTTRLEAAYESNLIFEAVNENKDLKVKIFKQIDENNDHKPWYFTNTSSVPINILDREAQLGGRVLGFHFYNPPAVQKLVELIWTGQTLGEAIDFAHEYAKNLKKVVVPSNDFAGFIGNGHFMRDALHGITEAEKLSADMSMPEAIYAINKITQDFLIRPMGIFQLIDYVGIDVVRFIMGVMNPFLEHENLHSPLLDKLFDEGVKGGQNSDGSQKDGFLKYEKGKPVAVIDPDTKTYVSFDNFKNIDEKIGNIPDPKIVWKKVVRMKNKEEALTKFYQEMKSMNTLGAGIALAYGRKSNEIGNGLVNDKVAHSEEDVNTVLLTGFFHAYGPINNFFD
ncbi:MAG: 3-hydroxyacyl-CoA dehydrogenase family protein [Bacteroidales bacterium]|nr:3-hydroxyacyl-CoA dehydrogenase family protein [Bacteroidales bacterium]